MKKLLALILALAMCVALAACGGQQAAETAKPAEEAKTADKAPDESANTVNTDAADESVNWRKEVVFAGGTTAFEYPDPQGNTSLQNAKHYTLTHDRLIHLDPATGALEPMLAESWDVSPDGMVYTFHLRKDVTFHNGEPFTADDVVFTAERGCEETRPTNIKKHWGSATWKAIDDYTVEATLVKMDADFLIARTSNYMGIVNREACEADPDKGGLVGTGLWIWDEYRGQDGATWVRNDNYWGESTPTERLTLRHIPEAATALIALQNGEISFFRGLSAMALDDVKADENIDYVQTVSTMCTYVGFNNTKEGPWNDVNFRKALAYAIDYAALAQGSYNGHAEQALTMWGHKAMFGYAPPAEGYSYDVEKAKDYLAQSSYNGEEIELMCFGPTWGKIGVIVADMFQQIGVNIHAFEAEAATYNSRTTAGDYEMCCYTYSFPVFGTGINNFAYAPAGSFALVEGAIPSLDKINELLTNSSTTIDEEARKEMYAELQELWMDELPTIPMLHNWAYDGIEAGLEGVYWQGDGMHDFSYIRIAED